MNNIFLQIASFTHPGNDLAHFLMTSTTSEFRKNNLVNKYLILTSTLQRLASFRPRCNF
jgi:hypothetical protein